MYAMKNRRGIAYRRGINGGTEAFIYASAELRSDRDFVLEMLALNPGSMQGASAEAGQIMADPIRSSTRSNPDPVWSQYVAVISSNPMSRCRMMLKQLIS